MTTTILLLVIAALVFFALRIAALNDRIAELEAGNDQKSAEPKPQAPAPVSAPAAVAQAPAVTAQAADTIAPEIMAVITAAVHAICGNRARIVQFASSDEAMNWAAEGRRAIFSSRKVR